MSGPHQAIEVHNARDRFTAQVFDQLWERYRARVSYVQTYESVVHQAGATFVNDHIAFRSFATQEPHIGISTLSRIFEALGYRPAGVYHFPKKHLNAIHYQHPVAEFPKLFISELKVWELPASAQEIIGRIVAEHRAPFSASLLQRLEQLEGHDEELMQTVVGQMHDLPWSLPTAAEVNSLNDISQYAAWVAVHGYNVNHFTSLINSHGAETLGDIDKTVAALITAGVPMKSTVEGEPGSKLRQTATEAVTIDVAVRDDAGAAVTMPWTYAYFELAERGNILSAGEETRFEGFLGPQANQLFEMTKVKGN